MRRLSQLTYDHCVVIHRFGDPPVSRLVDSTAPLAKDGIRAAVRWYDAGGERYAIVVSRSGVVAYEDDLLGEVSVVVVRGSEPVPARWRTARRRPSLTRYATSEVRVSRLTR